MGKSYLSSKIQIYAMPLAPNSTSLNPFGTTQIYKMGKLTSLSVYSMHTNQSR